jgi:hypothetical protein
VEEVNCACTTLAVATDIEPETFLILTLLAKYEDVIHLKKRVDPPTETSCRCVQ